jgi:signal transduction histidine kinase/CheY-like chemotaxis protein
MSKTKINNRLENLFADLTSQDAEEALAPAVTTADSWSWETDANGIYTACSEEVAKILGLSPADFIGSPLLNCHIVKADRKVLLEKLQSDEFPFEVDLHIEKKGQTTVLARFHVYKSADNFRGFSQLIEDPDQPVVVVEASKVQFEPVVDTPIHEQENEPSVASAPEPAQQAEQIGISEDTFSALDELERQIDELNAQKLDAEKESISKEAQVEAETPQEVPQTNESISDVNSEINPSDASGSDLVNDINPQPEVDAKIAEPATDEELENIEREIKRKRRSNRVIETPSRKPVNSAPDFMKLSKTAPLGPLPNNPAQTRDLSTAATPDINGLAIEGENFKPAQNVWTQQAVISFSENVVVSSPATEENPAILAAPLNLRNQKTGVIELISSDPGRKWSEEDRLLMQEISNQLGLALENAQLYSTVQKELGERVKAEEMTSRRNRDLSTLNEIGQRLSRLVSREEIFPLVSTMIQQTLELKNLLISLYSAENQEFSFPVCIVDGKEESIPARKPHKGYQEDILRSHAPLILNENPRAHLGDEVLDHPYKSPKSMLAIPLLTGDRVMGIITVFDFEKSRAFDQVQIELLSTVATQMATSLENADLFEGMSMALETIEVRELYQSNVTRAVALLSESGTKSLPEILRYFSIASMSERVYYAEPSLEKTEGLVWKALESYTKPDANVLISGELIDRLIATDYPNWLNDLSLQGWHTSTLETAEGQEKKYLQAQKIESLLLLAIPRGENQIGFIAFENFSEPHAWKKEEIDILRIGSDAFTNTLIREELLKQVESTLEETEGLYTASHQLALANDVQEMVASVIQGVHSQSINRGILVLFDYDENGAITRLHVEANYYSGNGTPPPPVGTEYLLSLYSPVFVSENPVFYDDINNSGLSQNLKEIFIRQNIHSMAVLPLWSANRQGGALVLITIVKHRFLEQEIRSLPPLADQMATTIENLRLFESTQEALAETELLYKISSGIASSTSFDELVTLVGENALPQKAGAIHLFVSSVTRQGKANGYDYVGTYTSDKQYVASKTNVSAELFEQVNFLKHEPQTIIDPAKSTLNQVAKEFFAALGSQTVSFVPMTAGTTPIGVLVATSNSAVEFDPEELQTLQVVADSLSVAIERQRLLTETQQRALELQAAAEIARDTTSTLSLEELLHRIVTSLKDRFGFYHSAIYMLDATENYVQIQEATGRAGLEMKQQQHKVAIGSKSVIGSCVANGAPVVINDTTQSPLYYANPSLPDTRSELCLPLKIGSKVIGALDLHANQVEGFTESELTVFQILTDQISVAIDNARAYQVSQQAVEEMRELDRVKSQFLANMSHELRTPLNSVIGFSRVILKGIDGPINDVQKQDISSIYSSGLHLLTMINEILDMSKIEAGKMELQLEKISIGDVVNGALTTASGLVKDKPIQLVQKIPTDLPAVNADEIRINQVIINLVSNAVKFTEKGTITLEASTTRSPEGKPELMITVSDTGIGIAPEDQSKLFQRFSQVDDSPTRKTGGTGLGLSICRSLVELHGGRIGLLSSEVGKGSTFYFTLPLDEPKTELDLSQLSHENNVILSIDDDAQVIALYERYLKSSGYVVIPETHPTKAVERAIELNPMAITLDIMMPEKDGWQVMRDLKSNEKTRSIPILVCSILEEEEKGFSLGATDYLVKPFMQDDLIKALQRLDKDGTVHDVLIVDDDAGDLRLTQKMIENGGNYHVIPVQSGKDALDELNSTTPDAIILDLFMPGLNGFDLLEIFRTDPRLNQIPVIILTGADLNPEQQNQLAEFDKHLFTKGMLKENDLLAYIEESLNKIKSQNK